MPHWPWYVGQTPTHQPEAVQCPNQAVTQDRDSINLPGTAVFCGRLSYSHTAGGTSSLFLVSVWQLGAEGESTRSIERIFAKAQLSPLCTMQSTLAKAGKLKNWASFWKEGFAVDTTRSKQCFFWVMVEELLRLLLFIKGIPLEFTAHIFIPLCHVCQMQLKDHTALACGSRGLKLAPWFLNSLPGQEAVAEWFQAGCQKNHPGESWPCIISEVTEQHRWDVRAQPRPVALRAYRLRKDEDRRFGSTY